MEDYSKKTDNELEDMVKQSTNMNVDGGQYSRAKNELEIRRSKRLFDQQTAVIKIQESTLTHQQKVLELQEKIYTTAQTRLDRIINILDKPKLLVILAGLGAVVIGVLINLLTAGACKLLPVLNCTK